MIAENYTFLQEKVMTKQEEIALELTKLIIIAKPDVITGESYNERKVNELIERLTQVMGSVNDFVAKKFKDC